MEEVDACTTEELNVLRDKLSDDINTLETELEGVLDELRRAPSLEGLDQFLEKSRSLVDSGGKIETCTFI